MYVMSSLLGAPIDMGDLGKQKRLKIAFYIVDGACLRGLTAHVPGKRWHLPTPFSSTERDFLLKLVPRGEGRLAGVAPVTHHASFFSKLFKRYDEIKEMGDPKLT